MSSIAAGTTLTTALVSTGDTTGELVLKTNGTTTAVTIDTNQNVTIEGDLTVNGTFVGGGDVTGPASSTDNAVARFDGTTGKLIQNSAVTIADTSGDITTGGVVLTANGSNSAPAFTASGDTNTGVYFPGADRLGFTTGGTQRGEFDTSGNFLFNSGYGSVVTAYGCRAWANIAGTTTPASIRASGNVSSITDSGTGNFVINFSTAMPDADYAVVGCTRSSGTAGNAMLGLSVNTDYVAGSFRINTYTAANAIFDPFIACVAVFR